MTTLTEVLLQSNSFTGKIPTELGNLFFLSQFDVLYLLLSTGEIPLDRGLLVCKAKDSGSSLSGILPDEFYKLERPSCMYVHAYVGYLVCDISQ